jgi:transposase
MTRKQKITISPAQKLEYVKLMVEENYTYKQIQAMSGACSSAVARWKKQYKLELSGHTPEATTALTPVQQRIQSLEKQLKRAQRDNDILKKATAFFIRDNQLLISIRKAFE